MQAESENVLITILSDIRNKLEVISAASRDWMTPEQLASYIGLSVSTIYQYVSKDRIPYHKIPNSSKLLFNRKEIDAWIMGSHSKKEYNFDASRIVEDIWEKV